MVDVSVFGLTTACLYNTGCCFFMYYWRLYKLQRMKEEGTLAHIKTVNELLDTVDDIQSQAAKSNLMIAGEAVEARRRGMTAKTLPAPGGGGGAADDKATGKVPALGSVPSASYMRASSLRSQHALMSGEPVPRLGATHGSFAGGSQYFTQPQDQVVHAAPRMAAGQPYVSFRHTPSSIWGSQGGYRAGAQLPPHDEDGAA